MKYISRFILPILLLVLATSCKHEAELVDLRFSSLLEQPDIEDSTKNYLSMERYIYWQDGDEIKVLSGSRESYDDYSQARTVSVEPDDADKRHANFNVPGIEASSEFYGIFPASAYAGQGDPLKFTFPSEYDYSSVTNSPGGFTDNNNYLTFPKPGIPMVAYHNDGDPWHSASEPALDFHTLCGLARIQITSSLPDKKVSNIVFEAVDGSAPIAATFTVQDIKRYDPYVSTPTESTSVTLNNIGQPVGPGKVLTVYLPLPATQSPYSSKAITHVQDYRIKMTVNTSTSEVFTKVFNVKIRRNSLSYLPAIQIDAWAEGGASTVGLVGLGTQLRPYQIYSVEDLVKLRTAFAVSDPKINGVPVTTDTYFSIVRSDIELTSSNWTAGIANFIGHMEYHNASTIHQGIENNSQAPLFASIAAGGLVEDLTIRGTVNYTGSTDFSPLCHTNNGEIIRCHNNCSVTATIASVGGICVDNQGTITNAANAAPISAGSGKFAGGICVDNHGTIDGYGTSYGSVTGSQAATICHTNYSLVKNCQITLNRTDLVNPFGGLVYMNETGAEIFYCQVLGMATSTSSIGGICYSNAGTVDQCKIGTSLLSGRGTVGGIVARMESNTSAEVRNCYNTAANTSNLSVDGGEVGGIVGNMTQGKIYNCYCNMETAGPGATNYGAIVGRVRSSSATIENCYNGSSMARFAGACDPQNIDPNCFDITNDIANCCRYDMTTGLILYMTLDSRNNGYGTAYEGGIPGDTNYLVYALNAWVDAHSSSRKYLRWTTEYPASNAAPALVPSTTVKSKKTPTAKRR